MSASVFGRFHRLSETLDGGNDGNDNSKDTSFDPHVMSEEEIMHKYWKMSVSNICICMHDSFNMIYTIVIYGILIT